MATQGRDGAARDETSKVGRRGLVAAAAAMAVGLAARHVADATPVAAVTTDTNFIANGTVTNFDARGNASIGFSTFFGAFDTGVYGFGGITGVRASGGPYGVIAFATSSEGKAVYGTASGTGSYGVLGNTTAAGSVACSGQATGPGSYGVYGTSTTGHGVYGVTAAPGQSSVYGYAVAKGAAAISGVAGAGAYAGTFTGPVVVNGDFVAYGGVKSGAVPHPDGSHRLLYCVESPEPWFEDFGEGKLVGGRAEVKIDPDFAAVVDTRRMHVFVTPHDEDHQLAVKARRGDGFAVAASEGVLAMRGKKIAEANGTFSYRVVARRKDAKEGRLAKFALPKVEGGAPPVPKVPELPKTPELPGRGNGR